MGRPVVVVVADDFGISDSRNRGIVHTLLNGVVTATSIMANGPAALDALQLARDNMLLPVVGLHLNLTEGSPLSDPLTIPSLVTESQQLLGKNELRAACEQGLVRTDQVLLEVQAQIGWFIEHVGRVPSHLDGHQHCHVIPLLAQTVAAAMRAHQIKATRIPEEPSSLKSLCSVCSCVSAEAAAARAVYSAHGIAAAASFVGLSFCGSSYSATDFVCAVRTQLVRRAASVCEVMVHPGLAADTQAYDDFGRSSQREQETQVLCSEQLKHQLDGLVTLGVHGECGIPMLEKQAECRRFLLFNKRLSTSPRIVVTPASEQQVCDAIRASEGPVTVISGGHHYEGWSALDGATVISMSLMQSIVKSPDGAQITIGAGVLNRDLWQSCADGAIPFVPTGDCESVSLVGSVLSGGINNFQRQFGLLCDLVLSFRIVLPSGEATTVSSHEDRELFWALRGGGGGNFGVVVSVTLKTVAAPPEMVGVTMSWPAEHTLQVLHAWAAFAWDTDHRLVLELSVSSTAIGAAGVFCGSRAELQRLVESLVDMPKPQYEMKLVGPHTFWELYHYNDDVAARWKNSGMFLAEPMPEKTLVQLLEMLQLPELNAGKRSVQLSFVPLGGCVNKVPLANSAFAARGHKIALQIIARWQLAKDDDVMMSWVSKARTTIVEGTVDTSGYVGWAEGELDQVEALQWYYGAENTKRLIQVKTRVDPSNLFSNPHSIPILPNTNSNHSTH